MTISLSKTAALIRLYFIVSPDKDYLSNLHEKAD